MFLVAADGGGRATAFFDRIAVGARGADVRIAVGNYFMGTMNNFPTYSSANKLPCLDTGQRFVAMPKNASSQN